LKTNNKCAKFDHMWLASFQLITKESTSISVWVARKWLELVPISSTSTKTYGSSYYALKASGS